MELRIHSHVTLSVDECLLRELGKFNDSLSSIAKSLEIEAKAFESVAFDIRFAREKEFGTVPSDSVGIKVTPDSPSSRDSSN